MAALQVKQICMYLELADLPKIINTKLDQGEDRLTQTLVFPKFSYIYRNIWCLNRLAKKYYDGKCSHSTFYMPKAKTVTQIRPDEQHKGERKAQSQRQ